MKLVYFTPKMIEGQLRSGPPAWQAFNTALQIFGGNAATMDRTGTIESPFDFHVFDPIPFELRLRADQNFSSLCLQRAHELLTQHDQIEIMYSGGLDSTCVLLAFRRAMLELGYQDWEMNRRLTVLTTPEAERENPVLWREIIGKFRVRHATVSLMNRERNLVLRVQGEHADQLFGSDRVMATQWLMDAYCTVGNINRLVSSVTSSSYELSKLTNEFSDLAAKCPRKLETMRDFMWWVNFTCKWQSVTFRTLAFSKVLVDETISVDEVRKYHTTFFNTPEFQALAMSGTLKQWGDEISPRTYKQAARDFIFECMPALEWYCKNKVKVGSLYNVIRQTSIQTPFIGIDLSTNSISSHANPLQ